MLIPVEGMGDADLMCLRDYSGCPKGVVSSCSTFLRPFFAAVCSNAGWTIVPQSGGLCKAPTYYDGSCPEVLDLRAVAPQVSAFCAARFKSLAVRLVGVRFLQEKTSTCTGLEFPCVGECTADYSQPCPADWALDGAGSCVAPASYDGPCVQKKSFADIGWFPPPPLAFSHAAVAFNAPPIRHCR